MTIQAITLHMVLPIIESKLTFFPQTPLMRVELPLVPDVASKLLRRISILEGTYNSSLAHTLHSRTVSLNASIVIFLTPLMLCFTYRLFQLFSWKNPFSLPCIRLIGLHLLSPPVLFFSYNSFVPHLLMQNSISLVLTVCPTTTS